MDPLRLLRLDQPPKGESMDTLPSTYVPKCLYLVAACLHHSTRFTFHKTLGCVRKPQSHNRPMGFAYELAAKDVEEIHDRIFPAKKLAGFPDFKRKNGYESQLPGARRRSWQALALGCGKSKPFFRRREKTEALIADGQLFSVLAPRVRDKERGQKPRRRLMGPTWGQRGSECFDDGTYGHEL